VSTEGEEEIEVLLRKIHRLEGILRGIIKSHYFTVPSKETTLSYSKKTISYQEYITKEFYKQFLYELFHDIRFLIGSIILMFLFTLLVYNAIFIVDNNENAAFPVDLYQTFSLPVILFIPLYLLYDWLPALYGGNIIINLAHTILTLVQPFLIHLNSSKITINSPYINITSPAQIPFVATLPIMFYAILSLIGVALSYDKTPFAIPLYFFTISTAALLYMQFGAGIQLIIFVLVMQYILLLFAIAWVDPSEGEREEILFGIFFFIFAVPFLPWLWGISFLALFIPTLISTIRIFHETTPHITNLITDLIRFFFTNRKHQKLINELDKKIKQLTISPQQNTQTFQESRESDQQSLTTPQQTASQITTETSPQTTTQQVQTTSQINQATQQTFPPVQQDMKIASQQTISQMISSQPASQPQISPPTTQQPSIKQVSQLIPQQPNIQQQVTSQAPRQRLQHTPRADMLIRNFEKALDQVKNIKGDSSEIYYKSIVLTYHSIIGIYLRKIYYGEPLKYHHLIQYFMVRGLITEELGKTLLDLSRKNWRLQNDPSFTANRELMLETMNATYQLLNELKNKKELLEKLLIEKKAHGGKLRL
jgi:hypothetical protein